MSKMDRLRRDNPWHVQVFFLGEWVTLTMCPTEESAVATMEHHRRKTDRELRIHNTQS